MDKFPKIRGTRFTGINIVCLAFVKPEQEGQAKYLIIIVNPVVFNPALIAPQNSEKNRQCGYIWIWQFQEIFDKHVCKALICEICSDSSSKCPGTKFPTLWMPVILDNLSMVESNNPEGRHKTQRKQRKVDQRNLSPKFKSSGFFHSQLFLYFFIELLLSFQFFFFVDRNKIPFGRFPFKKITRRTIGARRYKF